MQNKLFTNCQSGLSWVIHMCNNYRQYTTNYKTSRSSHWMCSVRKGVLRNFAKFTGKHLGQNLFFNKVACLRPEPYNFIKKEVLAQVLSFEFCEISKNTFSYRAHPVVASGSFVIRGILTVVVRHMNHPG